MRRMIVAAALIASGAVFAADLAKDRLDRARAVYPNSGVEAMAGGRAAYGDDTLKLAPSMRFRLVDDVDADVTYAARWQVPDSFGYHPPTFDSTDLDPASAGDSRFRDDSPPREGGGAPRVQF